jgi:hypothetical protein
LISFLVPLIYVLFFVRYWRESRLRPEIPWDRLMLVAVVGMSMFLTVASAASYHRLYTVSLPALILTVWFLNTNSKLERILLRGLWTAVLVAVILRPLATQTSWSRTLDLPTGRTAFFNPASYQKAKWLLERTKPGDYFFGDQLLGFALRLQNPGRVDFVRPTEYTRPEQVADLVRGLETHQVRYVSWYAALDNEIVDPRGDHLGPLRAYLHERYRVAAVFGNGDEVWERWPSAVSGAKH